VSRLCGLGLHNADHDVELLEIITDPSAELPAVEQLPFRQRMLAITFDENLARRRTPKIDGHLQLAWL